MKKSSILGGNIVIIERSVQQSLTSDGSCVHLFDAWIRRVFDAAVGGATLRFGSTPDDYRDGASLIS